MNKGLFVAIEGADAAGKRTQAASLNGHALSAGLRVATTAFPRYDTPIGKEIKDYLFGKYGSLEQVDTRFASLLYMMDRHEAQEWITGTLNRVDLLISDRYSAANVAHQGAKAKGRAKGKLVEWLHTFEHGDPLHHIMPDKIIYLDLPPRFAQKAMQDERRARDIHERDISYQEAVRKTFLELAHRDEGRWTIINCLKDKKTRFTQEEVAQKIWNTLSPQLKAHMTQIYFAASIRGDDIAREDVRRIGDILALYGNILTPHVMSDNVKEEEAAKRAQGTNIFKRDIDLLDHANILVAEITPRGSYGVGREVERAVETLHIPALLFFNAQARNYSDVTGMFTEDKRVTVVPYTSNTLEDIVQKILTRAIHSLGFERTKDVSSF